MILVAQFGVAVAMLATAGAMIFYEYTRSKTDRPLRQNEALAVPYWMTYLVLLVLGTCMLVYSITR